MQHWPRKILPLVAVVALLAGCDWAQYGFDASNTGHDLGATAFTTSSVATLHSDWSVAGPSPSAARLAVVNDSVYVAGADTVGTNAANGPVEALDAATGAQRWVVAPPPGTSGACPPTGATNENMGGPAVVNGQLLFLAEISGCTFGSLGAFGPWRSEAVDAATGAIEPAPTGYTGPVHGEAVVASEGGVYASVDNFAGTSGGAVPSDSTIVGPNGFAFQAQPLGFSGWVLGPPALDAQHVYASGGEILPNTQEVLVAVDRSTASEAWRALLPVAAALPVAPTPSVGNGRVFVSTGTKLVAYDPAGQQDCTTAGGSTTCNPIWSVDLPDASSVQAPAISRHRVFVRSGTTLSAYSTDDGALLWRADLGAATGGTDTLGPPSVAAGVVFVGTQDGRLLAFDATGSTGCTGSPVTCTPLWSATLTGATSASRPVIAGDAVYISSADTATASRVTKFVF